MHTRHVIGVIGVLFMLVGVGACTCGPHGYCDERGTPRAHHARTFESGAVACDHAVASEAGAEMLALGGNAVDAAVASAFALSVVRPYSCGIGGGGFMVVYLEDDPRHGTVDVAIDFRETCPASIGPDSYEQSPDPEASTNGGMAVAVPGAVHGLLHALETYGTLDRATVLAPAIRAAREGFVVDRHYMRSVEPLLSRFERDEAWRERFAFVWGRFLRGGDVRVGDRIVLPEQALALARIAENGARGFWGGETGDAIVRSVRAAGGDITPDDLRSYRVVERRTLGVTVGGYRFVGMPPPSSGGVTMFEALKILERRGHGPDERVEGAPGVHAYAEALKHAFADRARWLADPDFVDVPTGMLLSDETAEDAAARFSPERTRPAGSYGVHAPVPEDGGTTHMSVVDAYGGAVACTMTINLAFGSLVDADGCGFMLNNEMDDFTTKRGAANAFGLRQSDNNLPEPGKRPLSSMSPTIVVDDEGVVAVAGASGGPRIITGTMQALMNALSGMDAGGAVARPRVHHQWMPDRLDLEPHALPDPRDRSALEDRGHELGARPAVGVVQLIKRAPEGGWEAASDPRKGGRPAGI